ncbi:hypothetical protein QAD02_001831 [Eretmocerus hayati]|uniref:Uncharacterized protein n=2 Tax=Eretmocerus hayati TaxID=131215 RepID=A0ACC2NDK5_9HYME|nr:hypothetical protein QAD02_000501 [Eretmocerus hayati]KAJ8670572.1 hypothetical protein QAD02_001831 [Eretmocerus hayati]
MNAVHLIDFTSHSHPTISFELEEHTISLETLNQYFPSVKELEYFENGQTQTIQSVDRKFMLPPNIQAFQVIHGDTAGDEIDVTELIRDLFHGRYTYKEISQLLLQKYNIKVSVRSLQKIYRYTNLKRKNIIESDLDKIIEAILMEMMGSGISLGHKLMWQRLRDKYHLDVKQKTVLELMRIIDPEGIEERSRYKLKRRIYWVPGPNFLWHIDGFDKLKYFGFAITGCVDGFSRKVIWVAVGTTNNKPEVIAWHYLNAVKEEGCVPCMVRCDDGTENVKIELLQIALRSEHDDENANTRSFIRGPSTANERIEKYWRQLINHTAGFYITLFKNMEARRELDRLNPLHIEVLRYCFGPLLRSDIDRSTSEWNSHRIRQQHDLKVPCGIPDIIYHCPEKYGARNCGKDVHLPGIDALIASQTIEPRLYDEDIETFIKLLLPNSTVPTSIDEAYTLFRTVIEMVDSLEDLDDDSNTNSAGDSEDGVNGDSL